MTERYYRLYSETEFVSIVQSNSDPCDSCEGLRGDICRLISNAARDLSAQAPFTKPGQTTGLRIDIRNAKETRLRNMGCARLLDEASS